MAVDKALSGFVILYIRVLSSLHCPIHWLGYMSIIYVLLSTFWADFWHSKIQELKFLVEAENSQQTAEFIANEPLLCDHDKACFWSIHQIHNRRLCLGYDKVGIFHLMTKILLNLSESSYPIVLLSHPNLYTHPKESVKKQIRRWSLAKNMMVTIDLLIEAKFLAWVDLQIILEMLVGLAWLWWTFLFIFRVSVKIKFCCVHVSYMGTKLSLKLSSEADS